MQSKKRARGRPVGTGINDSEQLARMADLMAAEPATKPTIAARQAIAGLKDVEVYGGTMETRLTRKFRKDSDSLMCAARERRLAIANRGYQKSTSHEYSRHGFGIQLTNGFRDIIEQARRHYELPSVKTAMGECFRQARVRADILDAPVLRLAAEFAKARMGVVDAAYPSAVQQLLKLNAQLHQIQR